MQNPYLELTAAFNRGALRVLLSSGQAVVAHRLAIMSKDGDWIVRDDDTALRHVLEVLAARGSRYRFGAPLDRRWLAGGWSSHLEHRAEGLRLRTDFVARPPRIPPAMLAAMWREAERTGVAVVGLEPLARIKLTDREKDYAVIGELARAMTEPRAQLLWSRSARDLVRLAAMHKDLLPELARERPLLARVGEGEDALETALDRERRDAMHRNGRRLDRYAAAAARWADAWPAVAREIAALPLPAAHAVVVARAGPLLPEAPVEGFDS